MSYYNNWDDQDDWSNEQNRHHEMEQQLKEERYFDECWDLHTGLTDHIYDNCIPILQNSRFEHFYELCKHGEKYIVDLENKEKRAEQNRLNFFQNINKPIKPTSPKWVVLGGKKNNKNNKNNKKEKPELPKIEKTKNPMQKFNWTKHNKKK
jgi:hypothetical protein